MLPASRIQTWKGWVPWHWPKRKSGRELCRYSHQSLSAAVLRLSLVARAWGTKTDEVPFVTDQASFGFGVRVIAGGQWGFAASRLVSAEEIARITREAVVVTKANAVLQASPVQLAPASRRVDRWISGFQKDPFGVSGEEKLDLIHSAAVTLKKDPKIMFPFGTDQATTRSRRGSQ